MPRPHQSSHLSPSQSAKLLEYLKSHPKGITDMEALMFLGIRRLAARIHELAKRGIVFVREWVHTATGKLVMRYSLPAKKRKNLGLRLTR